MWKWVGRRLRCRGAAQSMPLEHVARARASEALPDNYINPAIRNLSVVNTREAAGRRARDAAMIRIRQFRKKRRKYLITRTSFPRARHRTTPYVNPITKINIIPYNEIYKKIDSRGSRAPPAVLFSGYDRRGDWLRCTAPSEAIQANRAHGASPLPAPGSMSRPRPASNLRRDALATP